MDKNKVNELKKTVASGMAQITAGRAALKDLEKNLSPAIEALVTAGGQLGPYSINGEVVRFRKSKEGHYTTHPQGEAL